MTMTCTHTETYVEAQPCLKWIGGKRQLVPELLKYVPKHDVYHEPFFGGGALFFALANQKAGSELVNVLFREACLNDANPHLINVYKQVRDNVEAVIEKLAGLDRVQAKFGLVETYAKIRQDFNACCVADGNSIVKRESVEGAAWFIAINAWGFNGLWRVHQKKGTCNVPVGKFAKTPVLANKADNLRAASRVLRDAKFSYGDFGAAVGRARAGDLVYCFTPGSMVLTNDEEYKPIEAVGEGEKLWGGRTVKQTMRRRYIGTVRRIRVQGSPWTASVTAEHPVLSIPGRRAGARQDTRSVEKLAAEMKLRPASALRKGDYVLLPTGDGDRQAVVPWARFLSQAAAQKELGLNAGSGEDLARLLGYYAAEGYTVWMPNGRAASAIWSFSKDEHEYIADVADLCRRIFGIEAAVHVGKPHASVTQVRLDSVIAATFISSLVPGQVRSTNPDRRYTMRLSQVLMTAPHTVQLELLKGWLRGDGGMSVDGQRNRSKLTGTGAAQHMVLQFYRIAQRLGLRPSWKLRENNADVYFSVAEDIEKLGFDPGPRKRQSCAQRRFVGGYLAVRIKEITDLDYCGEVYNLDVDGDSLLAVDGIVSHNCDPPYIPKSATANFTGYTEGGFDDAQQMRLEAYARDLVLRGVHVIASNSDTLRTRAIWPADRWELHEVQARRAVNCKADSRGPVGELIIVGKR